VGYSRLVGADEEGTIARLRALRESLIDPWGNAYLYRFPGEHGKYDLSSFGADAAEGGEGENQDIVSW
jgi:type II secretory pathway pseudopilin PulG